MSDVLDILLAGHDRDDAVREAAAERLRDRGLPTTRQEDWKFTSLRPLEKFLQSGGREGRMPDVPAPLVDGALQIVVRNGRAEAPEGDVNGITVDASPELAEEPRDSAVQDIVTALAKGVVVIEIPRGKTLSRPIEVVFLSDGAAGPAGHHSGLRVVLGENAEATLVERHLGDGDYLAGYGAAVRLGANARLRHIKLQDESRGAFHLADTSAELARGAHYQRFILSLGGRLARDEVHAVLNGEGAELRLLGAYAGRGEQLLDHTTRIDHAVPRTSSHEVYKGVLDDSARGVFQGGILVRKDAQKTDGHQLNKALLLGPKAEIDSKPALEIFADDVKCSHGATVGELDADQLFYLRARGVPEREARDLLVQAFLEEIFDEIADETLRGRLLERLHAALGEGDATNG